MNESCDLCYTIYQQQQQLQHKNHQNESTRLLMRSWVWLPTKVLLHILYSMDKQTSFLSVQTTRRCRHHHIASSSSPPKALHLVLMSALIYDFPCSLHLSNKIARSSPQLSSSSHPMPCHIFRQRNFSFDQVYICFAIMIIFLELLSPPSRTKSSPNLRDIV